jgi:hypothetical protein
MPRVTFVKAARKDNPVCKKGESYYWWKFRYGGKRYSLTRPRQSELTQSEFLSQAYALQERLEDLTCEDAQELQDELNSIAEEARNLGEEQQDKLYNMPDQLQDGDVGQMLEERYNACEEFASELEDIAQRCDDVIEMDEEEEDEDFVPEGETVEDLLSEAQGISLEC